MVDKIYIKIICIAKVFKYPPKQNIQNGPKSEMVYPGIFDLIAKNAILVFFYIFFLKTQKGWNHKLYNFSKIFGPKEEDSGVISMI